MLNKSKIYLFTAGVLSVCILSTTSCSDDDSDIKPTPSPIENPADTTGGRDTTTVPEDTTSYLERISTPMWILHETHQNGTLTSSGGTDRYQYTYDGAFLFESAQGWTQIARYFFTADSSAINTRFTGTTSTILMKLEKLSEDSLHTRFTTNGNEYLYKYHKE